MTDRHGLIGYARSAVDAMMGRSTTLAPQRLDPADYGLVLVGTPVWGSHVSVPVRAYLEANKNRLPRAVGFFLTEGGRGAKRVFAQMTRIVGKEPTATLALKQRDVERAIEPTRIFVAQVGSTRTVPASVGSAHAPAP
jgi:hypothetical protein